MPVVLSPKVTDAGAAAAIAAANDGLEVHITHISFGSGTPYNPTGTETALVNQDVILPIGAGTRILPKQIRMSTIWQAALGTFPINEIGFWMGPVLFAVWSSEDDAPLAYKTPGIDFIFFYDLALTSLPANSVNVTVDPDLSAFLAALGVHTGAADAHPQYLKIANFADAQELVWCGTAGGTANAIELTPPGSQALATLKAGYRFAFLAAADNTGAMTVDVAGLGVKDLTKAGTTPIEAGDLKAGGVYQIIYDGTRFQASGSVGGGGAFMTPHSFTGAGPYVVDYTVGNVIVHRNGDTLSPADYDASNGTSITIPDAIPDDEILVFVLSSFTVADAYKKSETDSLIASLTNDIADLNDQLTGLITQKVQPNWIGPSLLGSGLTISSVGNPAIAALNSTDIAFLDDSNDVLRTYRFNGATWAAVGSDFPVVTTHSPAMAAMSPTDVAVYNGNDGKLKTLRFNGSTWSLVGSEYTIIGLGYAALAALNATDVAYINHMNRVLEVYRFNGSTWATVGTGLSLDPTMGTTALTALNDTDVAFFDGTNDELRTYRFDGSAWTQVGASLPITGAGVPALAALNETDVAFTDTGHDTLRIYRFDGAAWTQVCEDYAVAGMGGPAIAAMNGTDIAFIDSSNDSLRKYRFAFSLGRGPHRPS